MRRFVRYSMYWALSALAPLAISGCALTAPAAPAAASPADFSADTAVQLCVDTVNHYRLTVGLAPLARWTDAEPCAGDQARLDAGVNTGHSAFQRCGEIAQNECPAWSGGVSSMLNGCIGSMWAEGPGIGELHQHYATMSNTNYSKVACGFFTTVAGLQWAVQDYK